MDHSNLYHNDPSHTATIEWCVCMCVCVWERETETETDRERVRLRWFEWAVFYCTSLEAPITRNQHFLHFKRRRNWCCFILYSPEVCCLALLNIPNCCQRISVPAMTLSSSQKSKCIFCDKLITRISAHLPKCKEGQGRDYTSYLRINFCREKPTKKVPECDHMFKRLNTHLWICKHHFLSISFQP